MLAREAILRKSSSSVFPSKSSEDCLTSPSSAFSVLCLDGGVVLNMRSPSVGLKGSFEDPTEYVPRVGIQHFLVTIRPWVRVPVLSEQISVTAPRASCDFKLRTITLRLTILLVPTAIVIVKTTMRDAGIIERPVATA